MKSFALILISLLLTACGGGPADPDKTTQTTVIKATTTTAIKTTTTTEIKTTTTTAIKTTTTTNATTTTTKSTPTTTINSIAKATRINLQGTATIGSPLVNADVNVYNSKGVQCGNGKTDANGRFLILAECTFPILLTADTPESSGKILYSTVPTVTASDQAVIVNISPFTTTLFYIINGSLPPVGTVLSATKISATRLDAAQKKFNELLQPIFTKLNLLEVPDYMAGNIVIGQDQDALLDQISFDFEMITTLNQNIINIKFASENRVIALLIDAKDPSLLRIDSGLGITPDMFDETRLRKAKDVIPQIAAVINGKKSSELVSDYDTCYLHNGSLNKMQIFDAKMPLLNIDPIATNFKLHRFNTKVNFDNTTDENINTEQGDLAYISFDFVSPRGTMVRTYTWMVNGAKLVKNGCNTSSTTWKILGNQRDIYISTAPYALHKITYKSSFTQPQETMGTGIELVINETNTPFEYAQLVGPGLPADGVIYVKTDNSYLVANINIVKIRTSANLNVLTPIFDTVIDTQSSLLSDVSIKTILDSFYGNTYIIRLYKKFGDLYPTETIEDILSKRPQFNSEITPINYPTLDVNLDNLVSALQIPNSVTSNWSLPNDFRGYPLESYKIGFQRNKCIDARIWPKCTKRSTQSNEYFFSSEFLARSSRTIDLISAPITLEGSRTIEARLRLFVLDNLNRPLEVSVGMNYAQ